MAVSKTETTDGELAKSDGVPDSLIGRVVRTFELLAAGPMAAAEVARELDINRSTALRLLSELTKIGYVTRDPDTKQFATIPSRFISLATRHDYSDWSQIVDPILSEIRDKTGDSTILGIPANQTMVYLAYFPTFRALAVSEQLGTVRPMHCSALGKAYLSALESDALEVQLERLSYVGGTDRAAHDADELRKRVLQAREDGYALDLDETHDDVRCVAAPLHIRGSLIGAAGLSAPTTRLPVTRMRELGRYINKKLSGL